MSRPELKNRVIGKLVRLGLFDWMSDESYLKFRYRMRMNRELNLEAPKLFSEKMQWLKLYNRKPEFTTMVDKYEARKYVAEKIGDEYIIPVLGVWNSFDEINFDALPNQFVLKCTHDSGSFVICKDKAHFPFDSARKKFQTALTKNYASPGREWPYKNVQPRIIAEEYLENGSEGLHDYKIWCFNGHAEYVQYITGRQDATFEAFYDRDWNKQDFSFHNPLMTDSIPRPEQLEKLLQLAENLAGNIPFVRIDFYILENGQIKFGEITFYPMSGLHSWHPESYDAILGSKITLPQK